MRLLAIDPGNARSAWLIFDPDDQSIIAFGIDDNDAVLATLRTPPMYDEAAIEKVESFGMAVGAEVFATVHWSGRFTEALEYRDIPVAQVPRKRVKIHLCGSLRAKDPNIRQALIDRFGGPDAIGRKATPGPLFGVSKDVWSALAVAVTVGDGA